MIKLFLVTIMETVLFEIYKEMYRLGDFTKIKMNNIKINAFFLYFKMEIVL
jgi:hypothetical protein